MFERRSQISPQTVESEPWISPIPDVVRAARNYVESISGLHLSNPVHTVPLPTRDCERLNIVATHDGVYSLNGTPHHVIGYKASLPTCIFPPNAYEVTMVEELAHAVQHEQVYGHVNRSISGDPSVFQNDLASKIIQNNEDDYGYFGSPTVFIHEAAATYVAYRYIAEGPHMALLNRFLSDRQKQCLQYRISCGDMYLVHEDFTRDVRDAWKRDNPAAYPRLMGVQMMKRLRRIMKDVDEQTFTAHILRLDPRLHQDEFDTIKDIESRNDMLWELYFHPDKIPTTSPHTNTGNTQPVK